MRTVPRGGEVYLLSHIIHNFSEDQCLTISGHVHEAMKLTGHLLIIETVLLPGDVPDPGKMLDVTMLAVGRGQERTEIEYSHLLSGATFASLVVPTNQELASWKLSEFNGGRPSWGQERRCRLWRVTSALHPRAARKQTSLSVEVAK